MFLAFVQKKDLGNWAMISDFEASPNLHGGNQQQLQMLAASNPCGGGKVKHGFVSRCFGNCAHHQLYELLGVKGWP